MVEIREIRGWQKLTDQVGEGTLPWAIVHFQIFLNYLSQKFEKIKIKV